MLYFTTVELCYHILCRNMKVKPGRKHARQHYIYYQRQNLCARLSECRQERNQTRSPI